MQKRGLVYRLMTEVESLRSVPASGTTDALGRITLPIVPPFTDLSSIVPTAIAPLYKNRPVAISVVEIQLDHVVLQVQRTKAPVAAVLGAIVEVFEAAPNTKVYAVVRGR